MSLNPKRSDISPFPFNRFPDIADMTGEKEKIQEQSARRRDDEQKLVAGICRGIPKRVEHVGRKKRCVFTNRQSLEWRRKKQLLSYKICTFLKKFQHESVGDTQRPIGLSALEIVKCHPR